MQVNYNCHVGVFFFFSLHSQIRTPHFNHCLLWSRSLLGVLHFNENSKRQQATTKGGKEQYEIIFPKYKKRGYVVRKVFQAPTYGNLVNNVCAILVTKAALMTLQADLYQKH